MSEILGLGDPGLAQILKEIRGARADVQEANAAPLNIDACDCLACQASAQPNPKGECEAANPGGCDCIVDPNQPNANRSRG